MDYVARALTNELGRPVLNKTDLKGNYNLIQSFSSADDMNSSYPSLSVAIEDAGLKLEKQKVQLPVLVIDHIEKPTFN